MELKFKKEPQFLFYYTAVSQDCLQVGFANENSKFKK